MNRSANRARPAASRISAILPGLRCLVRSERGQALVEFALVLPILLILLLGTVEFGRILEVQHAITGLSRETANVASRGTSLASAVELALTNGSTIGLRDRGGVVASRIVFDKTQAIVQEQVASLGYEDRSRIGVLGQATAGFDALGMKDGDVLYVVELIYSYQPLTPLESITQLILPEELYDRSVF